MIKFRKDFLYYLEADRLSLGRKETKPSISDEVWCFQRLLRNLEYVHNCWPKHTPFAKVYYFYLQVKFRLISIALGFSIPINVFGPGLSIAHRGNIIINPNAIIGKNCRIHVGVNIGTDAGYVDRAPKIGDNVYIGPGAKIFGQIEVAKNVVIGANAVVNRSFTSPSITIGGVPARQLSFKGSDGLIILGADLALREKWHS